VLIVKIEADVRGEHTPSGSHHASAPVKQTPAQKANAYTALKLEGNRPGIRDNANVATKITDRMSLPFIRR
jgi:ABC-type uncharacterized transport system involved in gliding motility auxiliary subunit